MKKLYKLFFAVVSSTLFSQNYSVSTIPNDLLENANAVIRESSEDYTLKSVSDMLIKQTHTVTVLSSAGNEFSTVVIPYNPSTKISNIKVELFDAEGKLQKTFSKKDFSDYTNNQSAALYVDDRVLVLKTIWGQYPYTVRSSYETNTSNTVYLNYFRPLRSYNLAVEKASFSVQNNSGIKVRTKITEKPLAKLIKSEEGNLWRYAYENIPAITRESLAPDLDYLVPQVEFSPEKFTL